MRPMSVLPSLRGMILEDSAEGFWERFSAYAQEWPIAPEPLGSPILELLTPAGVLYAFDRGLTPIPHSPLRVLLHGVVEASEDTESTGISHLGGGRYELRGQVLRGLERGFYLFAVGRPELLFVLASSQPLPPGPLAVRLAPPLMAFRP
jgi:hypothetical protein